MRRVNFSLPKVRDMTINCELLKDSNMTNLKMCVYPVMEKLKRSNLYSR